MKWDRSRFILTVFAMASVAAAPTFSKAASYLRGAGDIRRFKMKSPRFGERVDVIYWIDGAYIKESLREVDFIMRDWRDRKSIEIDVALIDLLSAVLVTLETDEPYTLISGYRTHKTNSLLQAGSALKNVASNSMHIKGKAADIRLHSRSNLMIDNVASSFKVGGVGRYVKDNFVHIDSGDNRRHWVR